MLRRLQISNLAVIAEAAVEFGPGLNVLTGETGAGKSIVVDSLALLAGARAFDDSIRSGADTLTLTGVFEPPGGTWRSTLEEAGLETTGDALIVRREVNLGGRNRVFVNDQPTTLRLLADLTAPQLQIHSQREEISLLAADQQREWLDRVGAAEGQRLLRASREAYLKWRESRRRLERLSGDDRARRERLDLLRFQIQEIDAAALETGEDERLREERSTLRNLEAVTTGLGEALQALQEGEPAAESLIGTAERRLEEIVSWWKDADPWVERLEPLRLELGEVAREVRRGLESLNPDPHRLDALEARLATVERLAQKYGGSASAVLEYREEAAEELEQLSGESHDRERLESEVSEALERYREAAVALSKARRQWATELVDRVHRELRDLALKRARFGVQLEPRRSEGGPLTIDGEEIEVAVHGIDRVRFEFAPNPGEEARPLSRIVSGGELARVYLALQLAVRGGGQAAQSTLVFDEVDAGVGGSEAATLGEKLQRLAAGGQILCVTHLPQVASFADRHFRVEKQVVAGRTTVDVEDLAEARRIDEIARMLAGTQVTDLSRSHAAEMIEGSRREAG